MHGNISRSLEELQRRGTRFAAVESDGARLRAARDPMGLAPLFYRVVGQSLWLATEVSPLVALRRPSPDLAALSAQAALVPDDTQTGFEGIQRLLPGHSLHATRDLRLTQRRYWSPGTFFGSFKGNRKEAEDELWARLLDGVDRSLEGPTGILVSGGIDSAAVTAAAALLGRPLSLVHVAFPEFADAAEEPYARAVADSAHAELEVVAGTRAWHPEDDLEVSVIPYLTPPDYTANTGLAHLAERGLPVALDGNDGDGVLGYRGREWGELVATGRMGRLRELAAMYGAPALRAGREGSPPAGRSPPLRREPPRARPISSGPSDTSIRRCASGSGRSTTSAGVRRSASGAGGSSGRSCPSRPCAWKSTSCAAPVTASTSSSLRRPQPRRVPRVAAGRGQERPDALEGSPARRTRRTRARRGPRAGREAGVPERPRTSSRPWPLPRLGEGVGHPAPVRELRDPLSRRHGTRGAPLFLLCCWRARTSSQRLRVRGHRVAAGWPLQGAAPAARTEARAAPSARARTVGRGRRS